MRRRIFPRPVVALRRSACVILLASCILAPPIGAQDEPSVPSVPSGPSAETGIRVVENADTPFGETVDVELVNVEVWVTDRDGTPIRGLPVEDFKLLEDGQAMEISHFAEVAPRSETPPAPTPDEAVAATTPSPEGETVASPPEEDRARVVFVLDDLHLRHHERRRVVEDLRAALDAGTYDLGRVSLVSVANRVHIEAGFGSSREDFEEAFARIEERPAFGDEIRREDVLLMDNLREIWRYAQEVANARLDPCQQMATEGFRLVQEQARLTGQRTAASTAHLAEVTSALAGVPGPKMVFYAGNGLAVMPGADYFYFLGQVCPHLSEGLRRNSNLGDQVERMKQLILHANAQRVTFYMLDAGGLRAPTTATVDEWDSGRFRPDATFDQIRTRNLQNGLSYIATETGGRAIFNHNRIAEPLADLAEDIDHYYSLGYRPPAAGEDRDHEIEVEVEGRKLVVRHRTSYRDKPADERMADRLRTALLLDLEENPLDIEMAHRAIESRGALFSVPVAVTVPLDRVVLTEQDGVRSAHLRMQVAARDAEGRTSVFHQKTFRVDVAPQVDLAAIAHTFVVDLAMRGGHHIVAVGLRDQIGRESSFLASRLDVRQANAPEGSADAPVEP